MPIPPRDQWFVVQVLSGFEKKVQDNMQMRIKTEEMGDYIFNVLIPSERIQEIKRGKKTETNRKFFPGYIIVNMHLLDDENKLIEKTWYFIQETNSVLGFAGTKGKPTPMPRKEVDALLKQMHAREENVKPKIEFEIGDKVKVSDGPFENQNGIVEEIDPIRGKLRVSVSIFGGETLVGLEYWQVEKA